MDVLLSTRSIVPKEKGVSYFTAVRRPKFLLHDVQAHRISFNDSYHSCKPQSRQETCRSGGHAVSLALLRLI